MDKDLILSLPDEAFYNLLLVIPLENVIEFKNVYYEDRKEVFDNVRRPLAIDLNVPPDLSLEQMFEYENQKDDRDKMKYLLSIADYPLYALNLILSYNKAKGYDDSMVDDIANYTAHRDNTTLLLLQHSLPEDDMYDTHLFCITSDGKLFKSTQYLIEVKGIKPEKAIIGEYYFNKDLMIWLLDNFDFPVTYELIEHEIMERLSPFVIERMLERAPKEEVIDVYNHIRDRKDDYIRDSIFERRDRIYIEKVIILLEEFL